MIVHLALFPDSKTQVRNILCNNREYTFDLETTQIYGDMGFYVGINKIDNSKIFYAYNEGRVSCKECLDSLMIKDIIE